MGRIGRTSLKLILDTPDLELVVVNDIVDIDNIANLIKYGSEHGTYQKDIQVGENQLIIDGNKIPFSSERNPEPFPCAKLNIDVILESTGIFTKEQDAQKPGTILNGDLPIR